MNVNLKSMFLTCRAVVPQMLKQESGNIVNISSGGAQSYAITRLFIYGIAKAGVNTLTKFLAFELADKGIRVNAIMPGMIDSPMVYNDLPETHDAGDIEKMRAFRNQTTPMKHMGEPWDIAKASVFLASDEAKYITGQVISVDGGLSLVM
jgi:NAD(P)-dependent dehydrogenase (short-subunit alcohol dehydrogenase family)